MAKQQKRVKPKRSWSLRSQRSYQEEWRLESELKTCRVNIDLWKRKLATAEESKARQTRQINAGQGYAHTLLRDAVNEIDTAKSMISAFEEQAVELQTRIDALTPDAAKAADRAQRQNSVASLALERWKADQKLDSVLSEARRILEDRAAVTGKMRAIAESLDFERNVNLDSERFEALLHTLPKEISRQSGAWVAWFLGRDGERTPWEVHGGEFLLEETLASANAFRSGDCPHLTAKERKQIEALAASRVIVTPQMMEDATVTRKPGEATREVPGMQYGLLSQQVRFR